MGEAYTGVRWEFTYCGYNEEVRFSYGPDDKTEAAEWWPEIEAKEALLQAVTLETIVITWDFMLEDTRCLYLLFSRTWGGRVWMIMESVSVYKMSK